MSYNNPVVGRLVKVFDPHQTVHYLVNSNRDQGAIGALKRLGLIGEGQQIHVSVAEGGALAEMFVGEVRKTEAALSPSQKPPS